jgi:hypothetical protein
MRAIGPQELLIILAIWLLPAIFAGIVASRRGGSYPLWTLIGLLFGPFSFLALPLALALNHHKICAACRMRIHQDATRCPYCQSHLRASQSGFARR